MTIMAVSVEILSVVDVVTHHTLPLPVLLFRVLEISTLESCLPSLGDNGIAWHFTCGTQSTKIIHLEKLNANISFQKA